VPREGVKVGTRLSSDSESYVTRDWPDLWRIDLTTGAVELAAKGTQNIYQWVLAPDGGIVAYAYLDPMTSRWTVFRQGQKALYSRQSPRLSAELSGLGRTVDSVVVYDQSGEGEQVVEVGLDGRVEALAPGANVTGLLHSPLTGLLEGVIIDNSEFHFFDKAMQARVDAATRPFQDRNLTIESYTNGLDKVVLHTTGAADSGTFWLVDLKAHKADIIDNDFPDVPSEQTGATRRITYAASDGFELDGILTLPAGKTAGKLPVVVLPHGGPIGVSDSLGFDWLAQGIASRGYAVFQPNYRGSGGHGAAYQQAGFGEYGRKMLTDMSDGLANLAREGIVDPARACIVGASYGGYAAMAGITVQTGLYRCAVSISGLSDLPAMLKWVDDRTGQGSSSIRYLREAMGVTVPGAPPIAAISPSRLAARADAPLLLIHGRDDTVVPLEQSERMERAMRAASKPVQLIITDKEDHYLSREATRIATLSAAVSFIEKHNPPN
jgi:dienelactone hydrolase